jgi:DNA adenine methylase
MVDHGSLSRAADGLFALRKDPMKTRTLPHPIPYQGSKRNLAAEILRYFPAHADVLYEPFAGSAAITIAAAANMLANRYHINDLNKPLMDLWREIIDRPEDISSNYRRLWLEQNSDPKSYFLKVRDEFNRTGRPELFLYLLARCVKGSVRYNSRGEFNQSADNRRQGMKPETMRQQILGASHLLRSKTEITALDYRDVLERVTAGDLVYMDPPYQGVCRNRDPRYFEAVDVGDFIAALDALNRRGIRYLVSYDGRTGDKIYGETLPHELNLTLIELYAGRSSQATLLGRSDITIESLYLSPALADELAHVPFVYRYTRGEQLCLLEGRQ